MRRLYTNTVVKLFLFLLSAACTIGAVLFLSEALSLANQGCTPHAPYEDSQVYRDATSVYLLSAADFYRLQGEDRSALTFVEQQNRQLQQDNLADTLQSDATNFRFSILSADGKKILYSNLGPGESFESLSITPQYATVQQGIMSVIFPDDQHVYYSADETLFYFGSAMAERYSEWKFYSYFPIDAATLLNMLEDDIPTSSAENYILSYGILPGYPTADPLAQVHEWYRTRSQQVPGMLIFSALCALAAVVFLTIVCIGAGRRRSSDGVVMRLFDRIPYEFLLLLFICAGVFGWLVADTIISLGALPDDIYALGSYCAYLLVLAEFLILTTAVRVKARAFLRHTLLGHLVGLCSNMVNHLNVTWKCVLVISSMN